jgi:hypothetical protein
VTLAEFVLARRAEVERLARRADTLQRWQAVTNAPYGPQVRVGDGPDIGDSSPEWRRDVNVQVWQCDDEQDGCPDMARGWIAEAEHIAAHDPDRVLRRVEADRQIVALHHPLEYRGLGDPPGCAVCSWRDDQDELHGDWPCPTLRLLGAVDDDHPDYQLEWRP